MDYILDFGECYEIGVVITHTEKPYAGVFGGPPDGWTPPEPGYIEYDLFIQIYNPDSTIRMPWKPLKNTIRHEEKIYDMIYEQVFC